MKNAWTRHLAALFVASSLAGCATTQQAFYTNPTAAPLPDLCHAYVESGDPNFRNDLAAQITSRGADLNACTQKARNDNVATAAAVAIGIGALAVAASQSGGYASSPYTAAYGDAWDEFMENGVLVARCRDRANGQFVADYLCSGPPNDLTWPGPYE